MFYPLLDWDYVFWGRRPQRWGAIFITSYQRYILSTWFVTVDVNVNHLVEVVLGSFTIRYSFFPFWSLYCTLWKEVTMHSPCLRSPDSTLLEWNTFYFFCMRDLSLLPHLLIYAIIYLYQYRLMDIYFIYYSPVLLCCSNCSSSRLGFLSVRSCVPLTYSHHYGVLLLLLIFLFVVCLLALPYFLSLQDTPSSSWYFLPQS